MAAARITQKVYSILFTSSRVFVTAGSKHLKFWNMDASNVIFPESKDSAAGPSAAASSNTSSMSGEDSVLAANLPNPDTPLPEIKGFPASILASHANSTFVDVAFHGKTDKLYCITSCGKLCAFSAESQLMENWVGLESQGGCSITICGDLIAAGCGGGVVRIFSTMDLKYQATLPLPPSNSELNSKTLNDLPTASGAASTSGSQASLPSSSCIRFLPGATKIAVIYSDSSFFVYDITDKSNIGKYRSFLHHSGPIWDVQCIPLKSLPPPLSPGRCSTSPRTDKDPDLPDGTFVTVSSDQTMRFWNLGVPGAAKLTHNRWKNVFSRDLLHVAKYPLKSDSDSDDAEGNGSGSSAAAVPDSSGSQPKDNAGQKSVAAADPETENFSSPNANLPSFRSIAMNPNRSEIACGDRSGNVMIFDLNTLKCSKSMQAHDAEVMSLSYSPNGLFASASRDKLVHVFETAGYSRLTTVPNHTSTVNAVKFSNDGGKLITCGGDRALHISELTRDAEGRILKSNKFKTVAVKRGSIYDVSVDASNKFLVMSGQDKSVSVYNMKTGRKSRSYKCEGVTGELHKLDIDPSGLFIATAAFDKWIRIFDFYSGSCIGKVAGHSELVTGVKFTLDGRRLISIGADGCIFAWRLAPELTAAMQERLAEIERMREVTRQQLAASVAAKAAGKKMELKGGEVPSWAKTLKVIKTIDEKKTAPPEVPVVDNSKEEAGTTKKSDDDVVAVARSKNDVSESPPPPPPPDEGDGNDAYEDDFEVDDSNSDLCGGELRQDPVTEKDSSAPPCSRGSNPESRIAATLGASISVAAGSFELEENMNIPVEEDCDAPSMFYASIEGNIMDNMFENKAIGKDEELVKKDDDLLQYGDDDDGAEDSCYVKVMEDIAKGFLEGRSGDGEDLDVRESLSKNFRKNSLNAVDDALEDPGSAGDSHANDSETESVLSITMEQLEESMQAPKTTLKEERAIMKNSEQKKQTENAVEKMRENLSAMGFLSPDEINPSTGKLDINLSLKSCTKITSATPPEAVKDAVKIGSGERAAEDKTSDAAAKPTGLTVDTVDTVIGEGLASKESNKMFLSPATTVGSDEESLIGLSFANTAGGGTAPATTAAEAGAVQANADKEKAAPSVTSPDVDNDGSPKPNKSNPIQSVTSPSNVETADKENSSYHNVPAASPKVPPLTPKLHSQSTPPPSAFMTSSVNLRRPREVYKKTLKDLNVAMKNAFEAYQELLETSLNATQDAPVTALDDSVGTFGDSEGGPSDLLLSFRDSFASLQGKMAVLNTTTSEVSQSTSRIASMPSILEDSTSSLPPRPLTSHSASNHDFRNSITRPLTAPARDQVGAKNEAEMVEGVLEKYSGVLFQKMMEKLTLTQLAPK